MRKKKVLKILGTTVALVATLVVMFVVAFIFNPFEGSLPDMREMVPRDVDFFVRKTGLDEDFNEFPEPQFWPELAESRGWEAIEGGEFHRQNAAEVERIVEQLRDVARQVSDGSGGFASLLGDVIGRDVILAGKVVPPSFERSRWCAYVRVSWKVRFGWGLLEWDSVRNGIAEQGAVIERRPDGIMSLQQPNGEPILLGRHLDCIVASNDEDLITRSLGLARQGGDSFASSADYRDGVSARIGQWEADVGIEANAVEFYARPDRLFDVATWDDGWPDPRHEDDMNQRVLASFLNLSSWKFLTGAMIAEGAPRSLTMLGRIDMNRNLHTGFQRQFFRAEPQDKDKWLNPFLALVPEGACAAAALRMPAGDFLSEMWQAVDAEIRQDVDGQIATTGQFDSVRDIIAKVETALQPRTGVVFYRSRDVSDQNFVIETFEPSPAPHFAWVFWIDPANRKPIDDVYKFLIDYSRQIGFENQYQLPVRGGGDRDAAQEFTNRNIPATGELAVLLFGRFFVISNSGPLIRDMVQAQLRGSNILAVEELQHFREELPNKLNAFVFLQGERLEEVVEDYIGFLEQGASAPDPEWLMEQRPQLERTVLRALFPTKTSVAALSGPDRDAFEAEIQKRMATEWERVRDQYLGPGRQSLQQMRGIMRSFTAGYLQATLDEQFVQWQARVLLDFR